MNARVRLASSIATAAISLSLAGAPAFAASPHTVGVFAVPALSDQASYLVVRGAGGAVQTLRDGSDAVKPVASYGPDCGVQAAAAGTGVWSCQAPWENYPRLGLLDLATGASRPVPGAGQIATFAINGGAYLIGMGSQWLAGRGGHSDALFELNWHTGVARWQPVKLRDVRRTLDSPTLSPRTAAPYVTSEGTVDTGFRLRYHRGRVVKTISRGDCSLCSQVTTIGWRVAWIEPPASGKWPVLHVVNVKTGRSRTLALSAFPGAATADKNATSIAATGQRLAISLSTKTTPPSVADPNPPAGVSTVSTVPWPV